MMETSGELDAAGEVEICVQASTVEPEAGYWRYGRKSVSSSVASFLIDL